LVRKNQRAGKFKQEKANYFNERRSFAFSFINAFIKLPRSTNYFGALFTYATKGTGNVMHSLKSEFFIYSYFHTMLSKFTSLFSVYKFHNPIERRNMSLRQSTEKNNCRHERLFKIKFALNLINMIIFLHGVCKSIVE
jgi:hypothetical protein